MQSNVFSLKIALGHALVNACRSCSFLSPFIIGLSMYVHNHGSRLLVDRPILNRLDLGASYTEVQRYEYSPMANTLENFSEGYIQFVYDNAVVNIRTLIEGIKGSTLQLQTQPRNLPWVLAVPIAAKATAADHPCNWFIILLYTTLLLTKAYFSSAFS